MASNDPLPNTNSETETNDVPQSSSSSLTTSNEPQADNNVKININSGTTKNHRKFPTFKVEINIPEAEEEECDQVCRICHGGESVEKFVYPCKCRGTLGAVHKSCIELYLNRDFKRQSVCDICKAKLPVKKIRKSPWWQYFSDKTTLKYSLCAKVVLYIFVICMYCHTLKELIEENSDEIFHDENEFDKPASDKTPPHPAISINASWILNNSAADQNNRAPVLRSNALLNLENVYLILLNFLLIVIFIFSWKKEEEEEEEEKKHNNK
ncbi:E3 ubiquitin-protein ligase MARCH3 [Armadillidium vulgare]|nr:E3 ubiquitin-protein ligase MARCH3 [Armadillidium vulgare]